MNAILGLMLMFGMMGVIALFFGLIQMLVNVACVVCPAFKRWRDSFIGE